MKKRLLALCLVICMVLGMLPMTAFAATGAYVKATSIAVGDTVALVCDEATKELSGISTTSTKYGQGVDFPGNPTGVVAFTVVQGATEGTFAFQNGSNYLNWGSGNSLSFDTKLSANTSWAVSFDADGNAILVNSANDEARQIAWNVSSPRFANYKDSTLSGKSGFGNNSYYHVQLYKWDTSASTCQHTNTTTETVAATCTEAGSTTVKCDDCGATVSTTELAATGHTYVNGVCACGEEEPVAPTTGDGVLELTADILGLGAYAAGTKTVEDIGIEWIELGSYGNGIQMRIKNGNTATLFNTLALPGKITKIELTYNSAKSTYNNADAFTFSFGDAQDNLTATTKLSTVSGVKTYTVTPPAGSYTFFKMQLNLSYSFYWDSIDVYYEVAGSEPEAPACQHTNTTTETVDATCTTKGSTTVKCADCGATVSTTEIPTVAHTYVDGACSVCGIFEAEAPVAGAAYKFGMVQENVSKADIYYLIGGMAGYYMATGADVNAAIDVYLEQTTGGYYMYTLVDGVKTYINMVVSDGHVNGAYEATASTVYTYDAEAKTVIAEVDGAPYWFGTRNDNTYTTVGPCKTSYNGFYCKFYHVTHTYTTEVTAPDCENGGYTTYTCACGDTYTGDEVAALGHDWVAATTEAPKTCSVCGETEGDKLGTEANPIPVTFTMNADFTEGTAAVTVPAGTTYYYQTFGIGGMELTINDGEATLMSGNPRMPVVFSVTNDGEEEAEFVLTVTYPAGSQNNPVELQLGYNYATIEAGNGQGYFYTWTAPADGTLTLTFSAEDADWNPCGWTYVVNNMTSYAYGDTQWSDSDPVVNPAVVTVKAGDEIQLIVNAYDPADPWNTPAADLYTEASFECEIHGDLVCEDNYDNATHDYTCSICGAAVIDDEAHEYTEGVCACGAVQPGSELNPITLTELENTVENTGVVYYQCYFSGTMMHINSDNDYVVTVNGEIIESFFGMVDMDVETPNPRMPFVFSIEGEGTLQIDFEYPEGSMMNPADLYIGYNYAAIEAGNNQGYFYTWTAPADGTLTLTFSAMDSDWAECGWFYVVNNMTTYAYGDSQWSDSDPVVNPAVVTVKAGDEIQLIVNTYDPANMWSNPAGEVETIARFECDEHGDCEYEDNYDDATHDYVCTVCGTVLINDEAHDFGEGACVCGAEKSGSESNPIWLYEQENTVENEDKLFYQGYFSNMTMTVLGEGDFKVEYNGQTFNSENGMIAIPVSSPYPRMPVVFALEGNGTYQINFSFPEGHMENPAELNVGTVAAPGENTAAVPGNGTPYFYAWTAPMDGTLTINMVSGNFVTGIDNMTTGVYGDMQFASDGVTTFTVELNAGDEIRVTVGTEDYTTADVKLTAAFEEKGAEFAGMTMSLGESLAVNFVIDVAQLEGEGHVAVITKTYADGTDPMTVKIPQSEWAVYSGTRYYFTFAGVKAKEMTDEFTVIIYNAEGKQVSKTYTRTIEDYCRKQISNYEAAAKPDAERLALYVDILKYGAAAQTYFNYNVNKPATANLTAAQLAYGTQSADVTDIRVKGEGYMGATLSLVNEIQLNFVFSNAVANKAAYAVVTFEHYDGEAVSQKIEAADFQAYGTSGKYITVSGMKMADYLQVVTLTLYDANGNALSVTKDSVGAYVARMSDADPLYETVVKLGKSSLAYFK